VAGSCEHSNEISAYVKGGLLVSQGLCCMEGRGLDSYSSAQRLVAGSCEHGNEPSASMKGREFLD